MHAFNLPLFGTPAGGKTQPLPITHVHIQQCAQTSVRVGVLAAERSEGNLDAVEHNAEMDW